MHLLWRVFFAAFAMVGHTAAGKSRDGRWNIVDKWVVEAGCR